MFKIIITIIMLLSTLSLSAEDIKFNKYQLEYVKKNNPKLLKTYKKTMESIKNKEKKFAFFLFLSSDVPIGLTKVFSNSLSKINTDDVEYGIFFRGLDKKVYNYMNKATLELNRTPEKGVSDISFMFDPDFFEQHNIVKVPVLALSLCNTGNYYPSECETQYIIHGVANVQFFLQKISEKDNYFDGKFEK